MIRYLTAYEIGVGRIVRNDGGNWKSLAREMEIIW